MEGLLCSEKWSVSGDVVGESSKLLFVKVRIEGDSHLVSNLGTRMGLGLSRNCNLFLVLTCLYYTFSNILLNQTT